MLSSPHSSDIPSSGIPSSGIPSSGIPSSGIPSSRAETEAQVRRMLEQGQTFLAHDLAVGGLRRFPGDVGLRQASALALLRAGALGEAEAVLEGLRAEAGGAGAGGAGAGGAEAGGAGEETLGLLARLHKDRWRQSGAPGDGRRARDSYLRAFRHSHGAWTGINAATLSWIAGDRAPAAQLAGEVLDAEDRAAPPADEAGRYWRAATRGEALLLLGRGADALAAYAEAAAHAGRRYASVATTRRQLAMLAAHGFPVPDAVLEALRPPNVVVFVGHMLDHPDRREPRFPAAREAEVAREIARHLAELGAEIGYSSAACGADLLFLEAMRGRGAEVNVVLPYAQADFVRASVAFAGPDWAARFHRAVGRADSVRYVTEESVPDDDAVFGLMGRMLPGYAALASRPLGAAPTLLAVWDGRPGAAGGTGEQVLGWPDPARRRVIALDAPPGARGPAPGPAAGTPAPAPVRRQIKTLLFADVVGYSRLHEDRMPAFMFSFLQRVAAHLPKTPGFVRTWGDAIFVIMDGATPLSQFALALQEVVCDTDWAQYGLPEAMSIRIGLHAGPVYEGLDPFTGAVNYYGSHVNRAARIEPVTVPGNVYVSEQFAALLTAEQWADAQGARRAGREVRPAFACDYIGTLTLAKADGQQPTYHLRRADASG